MKARNKFQAVVQESFSKLPCLSPTDLQQAIKALVPRIGKRKVNGDCTCLMCGHQWNDKGTYVTCPNCGRRLDIDSTRNSVFHASAYFMTVRTFKGMQVLRAYLLKTTLKKGLPHDSRVYEVFQRWIDKDGRHCVVSRKRPAFARYIDSWNLYSDLDLRAEAQCHEVFISAVVGRVSVIPSLKRNGFKGDFHNISPFKLFTKLLTDSKVETLWKRGLYKLVYHFSEIGWSSLDTMWPSLRIALRHNYEISQPSLWCDYIRMAVAEHMDVRNPKIVCPDNLREAHDRLVQKINARRIRAQRELERKRYFADIEKSEKEEAAYQSAKGQYLDLTFRDEEIEVKPLQSVREFLDEGVAQHHCVFAAKYYQKDEALIFHALKDGKTIATIEFNLDNMTIVQCRGKFNSVPELDAKIRELINNNLAQISQRKQITERKCS